MAQKTEARPVGAEGATRALLLTARAEAWAGAKHPLLIVGFAGSVWLLVSGLSDGAIVWQVLSVSLGGYLLPLIGATFLLASWTASTEIRYASEEHLDSLTHGRMVRTLGLLGGAVGPLIYACVFVFAAHIAGLALAPAGNVLWGEIMAVFLAVSIAWVGGIALGRARRVRAAPVLVLIGYGALQLLGSPDVELGAPEVHQENDLSRLLLLMPGSAFDTPFDALMRPTWPRAQFLAAILVMLLAILVARSVRRLNLVALASVAAAAVLVVATAIQVLSFVPRQPWAIADMSRPRVDWELVTAEQVCKSDAGLLYCAYPGFEPWFTRWAAVVEDVSAMVSPDLAQIAQRPEHSNFPGYTPTSKGATTYLEWDRPGTSRPIQAFALASRIGHIMIGLPGGPHDVCDAGGQGRSVFPVWMAAVSVDSGGVLLADLSQRQGPARDIDGVALGGAEIDSTSVFLARRLVDIDHDSVRSVFEEHWSQLVQPQVTVSDVAQWFGLSVDDSQSVSDSNGESLEILGRLEPCD